MNQKYIIISVDTEEDNQWDLNSRRNPTLENIGFIYPFQKICEQNSVKPVYLCTNSVATNKRSSKILGELGNDNVCEIGSHLHAWNMPCSDENSKVKALQECHFPEETYREMIKILTESVGNICGLQPVSYRAGRYGINTSGLRFLVEEGYTVDSSVVPGFNYKKMEKGIDFTSAPTHPYCPSEKSICKKGDMKIIEIPLSVCKISRLNALESINFHKMPFFLTKNALRLKLLKNIWIRPTHASLEEMKYSAKFMIQNEITPVLNLMIHSSELMPGGSPYCRDQNDVSDLLNKISEFLSFAVREIGLIPSTYSEFSKEYTLGRGGR
jgi:hypothetical protein